MPLVVAIETDRRQAAEIAAVVRDRLHADLVLDSTAEGALAALGDRIPDLILTSALLSARDEAMLSDHLRALEDAAAHVQTLTVPVLGSSAPRPAAGRGMLSALLGERGHGGAAPDGCDPAVFAEQCQGYLDRAAEECTDSSPRASIARERAETQTDARTRTPDLFAARAQSAARTESVSKAVQARDDVMPPAMRALPPPATTDDGPEIDLSSLLDETVVEQLSAAIQAVTTATHTQGEPARSDATSVVRHVADGESSESRAAQAVQRLSSGRKQRPRFPDLSDRDLFDADRCGFPALLAKLDEITHMASPLPDGEALAGTMHVSR